MFSNTATTHLMKTKESPLTNTNKFDLLHNNDFVEEVFYCPVSGVPMSYVYLINHFTLNSQCLEVKIACFTRQYFQNTLANLLFTHNSETNWTIYMRYWPHVKSRWLYISCFFLTQMKRRSLKRKKREWHWHPTILTDPVCSWKDLLYM